MISDKKYENIILSPHLDDAVFSLGGFIAKNTQNVKVITFFSGRPNHILHSWWDKLCGFTDSNQAISARLLEDQRSFSKLGVSSQQLEYCSYLDIQYRQTLKLNSILNREELLQSFIKELNQIIDFQKSVNIYFPLMRLHPDHAILSKAAIEVLKLNKDHSVQFYAYQDLPYTYFFLLKKKIFRLLCLNFRGVELPEDVLGDSSLLSEPVIVPLSINLFQKKIMAIKEYKTQFVGLRGILLWIVKKISKTKSQEGENYPYKEIIYRLNQI